VKIPVGNKYAKVYHGLYSSTEQFLQGFSLHIINFISLRICEAAMDEERYILVVAE
jgi:hypothetical protein